MYVESEADHNFTAFLAGLTPGRVLRDRHPVTKVERKRLRFMLERKRVQEAVALVREIDFTAEQMMVANRWAAKRQEGEKR